MRNKTSSSKRKKITQTRAAGILMPVASLPSRQGIGSLGREAYRFVDLLSDMGARIWQILPLNPLGYGNSPYQPFSSFAGDELYIDLGLLAEDGLLRTEPEPFEQTEPERINYELVRAYKERYLREAFTRFCPEKHGGADYNTFLKYEWVRPYAVFIALKAQNGMRCWTEWPQEQQDWILDRKYDLSSLEDEISYRIFAQYMFYRQWMKLKAYANARDVYIMGDMPFYVGIDSLDVWGDRSSFLLNDDGSPAFVAGVPPDYFSVTGQRWGNPIYDWQKMQETGFTFWVNRLKYTGIIYDVIRIDHFRAFDTYWKIPASCETAQVGEWVEAPGYDLLDEIYRRFPDMEIVAEDLGDLRPEVLELRDHYGLPGMNIAQFTLLSPEPTAENQLIYTGTHDNQTVAGWYRDLSRRMRAKVSVALAGFGTPREAAAKKLLRYVMQSEARLAIVPLMDVLGLDDRARLNTPGTVGSPNWEWQLADWRLLLRRKSFLKKLIFDTGRSVN